MRLPRPLLIPLLPLIAVPAAAQERADEARYEPRFHDPVIEELRDKDEAWEEQQDEKTGAVRKRQKAREERERKEELSLKSSLPEAERPTALEPFKPIWHHPPAAQFMTGTCWSFAATSMLESEAARLGGKRVKLSEMHTVYHEYLEKARRYIRERGKSELGQGSECNAVVRIFRLR
jgi:bleomycin hydrolase